MAFDVPTTRGAYSSLSDGWTYLNGGFRAQIPERVLATMTTAFRLAPKALAGEASTGAHSRGVAAGATAARQFEDSARRAFADMAGAPFEAVALGPSKEVLIQSFTQAMSRRISLGTNLVTTRSGDATTQLLIKRAADLYGAKVRYAEADLSLGTIPAWQFDDLVDSQTALVFITAADPYVGTMASVTEISRRVRAAAGSKPWIVVDASSCAPYRVIDMDALGADIVLFDAAQWGGPEVSALVFRNPAMLERVPSLRAGGAGAVASGAAGSGAASSGARDISKLEIAPVAPALLGGVSESVRHIAQLDSAARGTRRRKIQASLPQVTEYLDGLTRRLIDSLDYMSHVHIVGIPGERDELAQLRHVKRIPRISFLVPGVPATDVVRRLLDNKLVTSAVEPEDSPLLKAMGIDEAGGAVTVGLQPFNTAHDIDQLVRAVASLG